FTSNPRALEVDALWLIEQGVLTQRTLTGERLLSLGANVQTFALEQYDTLRVAYVDDGALYEAAGPNFFPVLIAEDACEPRYDEFYLNFLAPCEERQLVRLDLTTGELE